MKATLSCPAPTAALKRVGNDLNRPNAKRVRFHESSDEDADEAVVFPGRFPNEYVDVPYESDEEGSNDDVVFPGRYPNEYVEAPYESDEDSNDDVVFPGRYPNEYVEAPYESDEETKNDIDDDDIHDDDIHDDFHDDDSHDDNIDEDQARAARRWTETENSLLRSAADISCYTTPSATSNYAPGFLTRMEFFTAHLHALYLECDGDEELLVLWRACVAKLRAAMKALTWGRLQLKAALKAAHHDDNGQVKAGGATTGVAVGADRPVDS